MCGTSQKAGIWRLSLEQIEATVADHLGRGRVLGNQRGTCFSRQISMYLAKNVGGWSTTRIGRFYNGRHHTTVLYAIGKIERLRKTDESVDALIEVLTAVLSAKMECRFTERFESGWSTGLIEAVAARVLDLMGTVDALHDESKYLAVVGFADQKVVPNCVPSIAHMPADGAGRNPKKSAAQRPAPMLKAIRRRDRPARRHANRGVALRPAHL